MNPASHQRHLLSAAIIALASCIAPARAELLTGLSGGNLISFDSATPGTVNSLAITGLGAQSLIGIDVRPVSQVIYGIGSGNSIFTINPFSGVATSVGTLATATSGTAFGLDFNPVPDRMRVVSDTEQNLRINVGTGGVTVDGSLAFAAADANFGINPNIVGVAYSNSTPFSPVASTTLYGIDSSLDILVIQNPPNAGTLNSIGSLGVNTGNIAGFDISGTSGVAYAALDLGGVSSLYTIDLTTGAASLVGGIGGGLSVSGLTVSPVPEPEHYAMIAAGSLIGFGLLRRRFKLA